VSLILLDGATGSGKSQILSHLRGIGAPIEVGTKWTTRRRRPGDGDWEFSFVARLPAAVLPFGSVGHEYGIDLTTAERCLTNGGVYAVTCGDVGAIRRLRSLGYPLVVIYVFRPLTDGQLDQILLERATDDVEAQTRRAEVASVATDYLSKLSEIDRVILNIGSLSHLRAQVDHLVSELLNGTSQASRWNPRHSTP
jgi:guanylate kinase